MEPAGATVASSVVGFLAFGLCCIICRIWKRNRYYKKVQHSLDEEERSFQECAVQPRISLAQEFPCSTLASLCSCARRTLARSYNDEQHLDGGDHEKLQMLEKYLQMQADGSGVEASATSEAAMPTRAEDVDKFMKELAVAATGGMFIPPVEEVVPADRSSITTI